MKLAILGVTLVIWSGKSLAGASTFTFKPSESGRLATENFKSELEAITRRNWYIPRGQHYDTDVFQFGTKESYLFVNKGFPLSLGMVNQVKFSFIRQTKNCTVGFMQGDYFKVYSAAKEDALGFDLRKGKFVGGEKLKFVSDVGKENDDLDWFIEYYDDTHVEIYMTLNGEPLGMVYRIASLSEESAARIRPSLRCSVSEYTDSANVVAVTQFNPRKIPVVRHYAAKSKPDGKNFELEIPFTEDVKRIFGLDYRLALHLKVNGKKLNSAGVIERHRCNSKYQADKKVDGPVETSCLPLNRYRMAKNIALKQDLSKAFEKFLETANYKRLPNGNLELHLKSNRGSPVAVFSPLQYQAVIPVDIDPFSEISEIDLLSKAILKPGFNFNSWLEG